MILSNASSTRSFESRFDKMGGLMTPINTSDKASEAKYELQNGSQEECPKSPDHAPYAIFDDPTYEETNLQTIHSKSRKKTLSFGKKAKLHQTESSENLLDDSEEATPLNPRMSDSVSARPQLPPKPPTYRQLQITLATFLVTVLLYPPLP